MTANSILFLLSDLEDIEDGNALRLPNACLAAGHEVWLGGADSLCLQHGNVTVMAEALVTPMSEGASFSRPNALSLNAVTQVWILSLGKRQSFLDKYQLLYLAAQQTRLINSLDAIMHLKSKYFLAGQAPLIHYPESHAACDPAALQAIVDTGGEWIAKPPAGSLGRQVFRLTAGDPNSAVILESLCGAEHDQYVLLQKRVAEISAGEKRVLIAGGAIVGQYLRTTTDHRTNLSQGGTASPCDLSSAEREYCEQLGAFLSQMGAQFVGIDLAFPWVIEFNVINPGGITTIDMLSGQDLAPEVARRVLATS